MILRAIALAQAMSYLFAVFYILVLNQDGCCLNDFKKNLP
ncbi:hypothetical protein Sta7437_0542 [Stanieria cyanosphaera PCC 7437]|uniref:Uncharacterized protein n=1 Tax=Stanieria cyanosphaera (strain ATCC 29371 / PCC 7437) TaxID=111780 RepID=K9XNF8_STAC7|nr:hypothetical protein Sta7437_0542 [Stanieria cyanosphaera PCC 7437]